ncbi:MAG: 4Fe-4S dicluster domain-containing protein [Nitrospirota bacterium]
MAYSVLVDVTKCIGCMGCQVSCKNWNDMPGEKTTLGETLANPRYMDAYTYTVVKFKERLADRGLEWHFTKQQCMHCVDPACVAACPCGALTKNQLGPVEYHRKNCIGCRYCMLACPFSVPTFEWGKAIPSIRKCTFCADRVKNGVEPACTKSCPSGALTFGPTEDVLKLADGRIASRPDRYVNYIYGKEEAGGTSWLYISDTDFKNLYLREDLNKGKYSTYAWNALGKTPAVSMGVALLMAGFFFISRRKETGKTEGEGR